MKGALLAFGPLDLLAQQPGVLLLRPTLPGALPAGSLDDVRDQQALLLGPTTPKAILAHWAMYRYTLAKVNWVGSVVETPPQAGQTMAEALVELVEAGGSHPSDGT
jgi:hypothetical protein